MGTLDQQQPAQEPINESQQLEAAGVDLAPEETTNISQMIELDLLGDKDKKKNDDNSDDEARQTSPVDQTLCGSI